MHILNRYIRWHIIGSTLIVVFVLIGIESFMELVGQLSDIGVGHYGLLHALFYVPLQLPTDLYELFPMAGFLGSLIGLGRLASTSQLVVMRAAGISVVQIAWSVIKAAILMIIVVTIIGEGVAPRWQMQAVHLKTVAMGQDKKVTALSDIWFHRGHSYTNIATVTSESKISNVTQFYFNNDDHLMRMTHAANGKKIKGVWQLFHVKETLLKHNKVVTRLLASVPLGIDFEPKLLKKAKEDVDQESILVLFHNILYRHKTGLVTSQYQYAFWKRVIQPITSIVMICLGIPFIFGSLRKSSTGFRIMMGVMIGFGFYMLNQFFGPITLVYQFPPLLAAVLPTVLFLIAYAILLKWII